MIRLIQTVICTVAAQGLFFPIAHGKEVVILDHSGELGTLPIGASDTFIGVLDDLKTYYVTDASTEGVELNVKVNNSQVLIRSQDQYRNYHAPLRSKDKDVIRYLLKRMAQDNPVMLWKDRSKMREMGDKIDHLHPFKFLEAIFTDEELIAYAQASRERIVPWIWDEFLNGNVTTLKEEEARNNVMPYFEEFAAVVKVDPKLLIKSAEQGKWVEFVNIVAKNVKRSTDPNRYDM